MFDIRTIELLISTLTLVLAYVVAVTAAGYFHAWIALKMGDDTAKQSGFLTLNPLMHVDPIGMFCLLFLKIGWGRRIPVNNYNIRGNARLALVYFADVFAYISMSVISLALIVKIFGIKVLAVIKDMVLFGYISLTDLSNAYPLMHSFVISGALVLLAIIYLSALLAMIDFVIQGFHYVMLVFYPHLLQSRDANLIVFFIPLLLIIFWGDTLRIFVGQTILLFGTLLGYMLGAS